MLRVLLFVIGVGLGTLVLEPTWHGKERTLALHVRDSQEVASFVGSLSSTIATRAIARLNRERGASPDVAAAPARRGADEHMTDEDRKALNQLIVEKIRASEAD